VDEQKSDQPKPDAGGKPPEPAPGWIEKLAQKSAGLPETESHKPTAQEHKEKSALWRFAGQGIQFAATIGLFALIGYQIDKWKGWTGNPALITAVLISVIGNLYLLIKEAIKANK